MGLVDGQMRNEVNSIVIQKFAKCLQTTLQVHDQAKFGFLLCKIFRGSQGTIFEETKNIQILKCNLRSYIFQLTLTTDYSAMQACIILFRETQTHIQVFPCHHDQGVTTDISPGVVTSGVMTA